ncbi:glycoside hydrolase family 2 TIM barrel-domain containing protein [Spirosoma aerophilum]
MTVLLGVWIERELDGFNYYDEEAIARQYERIRKTVLKFRHHPALLMWCVGNEWHFKAKNIRVYDEVNRIAKMIHELDPDHPVTTAIGLTSPRLIWLIKNRCPEVEVLSVNIYGGIPTLRKRLMEEGWNGPYIISEFGGRGPWESLVASWEEPRVPLEPYDQKKSAVIRENYENYIGAKLPNCLGSYVFLWGQKEECTHTWFSFFDEAGRETAMVETMQKLWTGQSPKNVAPVIEQVFVDGSDSTSRSFPINGSLHRVRVVATDPNNDPLTYVWEVRAQAKESSLYNYYTTPIKPIEGLFDGEMNAETSFRVPQRPGIYRLFVHVYDTHNHVASANIPLRIGMLEEVQ